MTGDLVELSLGLTYWIKNLPDTRPEYADLKALMMVSGRLVIEDLTKAFEEGVHSLEGLRPLLCILQFSPQSNFHGNANFTH